MLREAMGTALKNHGKREVLVLPTLEQLFTGTAASDGSRRIYTPIVPSLQAGTHKLGWVGKQNPTPGKQMK